jgi:hypothetical protein
VIAAEMSQDLQRECSASSWVEDDVGGVSALALDSATSCLFVGTHTGRVLVVNTDIGRITTTLAPFSGTSERPRTTIPCSGCLKF